MPPSIGEQLRQAREARQLTLAQAAQATHIRVHYLEAMENDRRDLLPSLVQGKGFLRLYADYLHLPTAPLLDQWNGVSPVEPPPPESPAGPLPESEAPILEILPEDDISIPGLDAPIDETPPAPLAEAAPNYQEIFVQIGQQLRQRRESLSLTLQEVERYTRLRQHYLQAMEEGRLQDLPSLVQGRGMLNNYASFLNLDEDALLLKFADALQYRRAENLQAAAAQPNAPVARPITPQQPSPLRRFLTPDVLFGGGAILLLILFGIFSASRVTAYRNQKSLPTAPPISNVLLITREIETPTATPTNTPTPRRETGVAPVEGEAGETTATLSPEELTTTPQILITVSALQVNIVASQRAWMRVVVDGKVAFIGRTAPGNAYPFAGTKSIELVTGNAAALRVVYNQRDLGTLGLVGQVVSLNFSPGGVQTPTPAVTPTFTPTPTSTPTEQPTATMPSAPTVTITPFIPKP